MTRDYFLVSQQTNASGATPSPPSPICPDKDVDTSDSRFPRNYTEFKIHLDYLAFDKQKILNAPRTAISSHLRQKCG